MKFKNIKLKYLIPNLVLVLFYPVVKAISSQDHILAFSDTCFIMAMIFGIIGIVNIFYLHGDMDITGFVAKRAIDKNKVDFDVYMKNEQQRRKDSFNYPLFSAIILLLLSLITSLFC